MSKLNKEELDYIRQAEVDFKKKKSEISDLEIRKHYLIDEIKDIQRQFSGFEAELIKKYGEDSVIDMSTGEVKKK